MCGLHFKGVPNNPCDWEPHFIDFGPPLSEVDTNSDDPIPEALEYEMVKKANLYLSEIVGHHGTVITFNGRGFDVPILFTRCMVFGLNTAEWYTKDFQYRFSTTSHLDLLDAFTENGAVYKARPSLSILAHICGLPGKVGIDGSKVKDYYAAGKYQEIRDYCMSDNLLTGVLFMRWMVTRGLISADEYRKVVMGIVDQACAKDANGTVIHPYMCQMMDLINYNRLFIIQQKKAAK